MSESDSITEAVEYREIPGTNGGYRAGSDGSIWCCLIRGYSRKQESWRRVNPKTPDPKGYLKIRMRMNGKMRVRSVHQLILEAFVGRRPDGMESRHLNGIPGDNRLENLRWGTYQENREDMRRHGRTCRHKFPQRRGPLLTQEDVLLIRSRVAKGETVSSMARDMGINYVSAMRASNGTTWRWLPGALPKTPGQEKRVKAILEEK